MRKRPGASYAGGSSRGRRASQRLDVQQPRLRLGCSRWKSWPPPPGEGKTDHQRRRIGVQGLRSPHALTEPRPGQPPQAPR